MTAVSGNVAPGIQNRLFEITQDAPNSVHFATDAQLANNGFAGRGGGSFTLVEKQRGSGNIWEVTSDSAERPEILGYNIIFLLSDFCSAVESISESGVTRGR